VLSEIRRQEISGYRLQKLTGMPLRTVQRFLDADGSPTVATLEMVAKALGVTIHIDVPKR